MVENALRSLIYDIYHHIHMLVKSIVHQHTMDHLHAFWLHVVPYERGVK